VEVETSEAETPGPTRFERTKAAAANWYRLYINKYTWISGILFVALIWFGLDFFDQNWTELPGSGIGSSVSLLVILFLTYLVGRYDVHDSTETRRKVIAEARKYEPVEPAEPRNNIVFYQREAPSTDGPVGNLWIQLEEDNNQHYGGAHVVAYVLNDDCEWERLRKIEAEVPYNV
jgi:hypothetical protein